MGRQPIEIARPAKAPGFAAAAAAGRGIIPRPDRFITLLMLGRLRRRGGDTICRIRNVSSGGMRIDTGFPLAKGERIAIEARSGVCIEGEVAWTSHLAAGIAFRASADHRAMLASPLGPSGQRLAARSPRFDATASARLQYDGRPMNLRLVDISLGGCRVESDARFASGVDGSLVIPGLPPLACTSRWAAGNRAGMIFHTRLDFATFARWLESAELRYSAALSGGQGNAQASCAVDSLPFTRRRSS